MKKFFAVLMTLVMMLSFASVAFAADYNWGKEPVSCEKYTIDITKYEMVVEAGKSKLVESANVAAKKGDTVYFSFEVYDGDGRDVTAEHIDDVTFTGIKAYPELVGNSNIWKAVVYADIPCITVRIESTSTIQELIEDGVVTPYGSFIKIGNVVFERDANYYVIGAYQYDKSLDNYLAAGDFTPVKRIKATEGQLAALGMSAAFVTEGVYLVDADTIVKNLGTSCLAEKTVCWGVPAISGIPNGTLEIPKTGDAPIGIYIGAALIVLSIAGVAWFVVSRRKNTAE